MCDECQRETTDATFNPLCPLRSPPQHLKCLHRSHCLPDYPKNPNSSKQSRSAWIFPISSPTHSCLCAEWKETHDWIEQSFCSQFKGGNLIAVLINKHCSLFHWRKGLQLWAQCSCSRVLIWSFVLKWKLFSWAFKDFCAIQPLYRRLGWKSQIGRASCRERV